MGGVHILAWLLTQDAVLYTPDEVKRLGCLREYLDSQPDEHRLEPLPGVVTSAEHDMHRRYIM